MKYKTPAKETRIKSILSIIRMGMRIENLCYKEYICKFIRKHKTSWCEWKALAIVVRKLHKDRLS